MSRYISDPKGFLIQLFEKAVSSVSPDFSKHIDLIPKKPKGKVVVIGAGKAAASMAHSFETTVKNIWSKEDFECLTGLVITRYQHGLPCEKISVVEASHPVPDEAGNKAALKIIDLVTNLTEDDEVICLISGGGSALLTIPADIITLEEKKNINRKLLSSGASISEMNTVRKHLSKIKGGRLAALCHPAKVSTFLISDVPGDDPGVIASGPTLPDKTSCKDALNIIQQYNIEISEAVKQALLNGALETPKPNDPMFVDMTPPCVMANAKDALFAAKEMAESDGLNVLILGDSIESEARELGKAMALMTDWLSRESEPLLPKPLLILSGGETTVTVKGHGRGGRNVEFLLSFMLHANNRPNVFALACDTDGIDGSEDNAGAVIAASDLAPSLGNDQRPDQYLNNNDAYSFFESINALIKTGPTRTNVNDFRAILITKDK